MRSSGVMDWTPFSSCILVHIWNVSSSLVSAKKKSDLCASRLLFNISQSVVSRKRNQNMCFKRTAWSKTKKLKNIHARRQDQNVNDSLDCTVGKLVSIKGRKEPLHRLIKWRESRFFISWRCTCYTLCYVCYILHQHLCLLSFKTANIKSRAQTLQVGFMCPSLR